jgi:hypothetical protein
MKRTPTTAALFFTALFLTRDTVGRLIGVTGSPFAGVTQYVTNVQYRAWGAVKAAAYRDDSATVQYNSRLLPTQFELTTLGFSTVRENYSYFADQRLSGVTDLNDTSGTNPPFTMRYLTRVYAYDHVGRVIDNHGPNDLPLRQSYSYDQFDNMQGRWGTYYFQGFRSQTASYINNRRTDWSYDAEGHVTNVPASDTDAANTFTYDAAGRLVMRVETTSTGTTTFSLTYDGDGEALSAATTPSGSASTVGYDIRSSVFGEVLTELDQSGNKRSTHIQADGLLFASQSINSAGASVQWTIRNPVGTGERNGAIYDPLGNYIPFQHYNDPRPPAGSYNSASMSSLAASQANPDSYGVGCMLDGLPTNCNRVLRAINNGEASNLILYGSSPDVALANIGLFLVEHPVTPTRPTTPPQLRPYRPNPSPGNPAPFNTGKDELDWGYSLVGFYQPQNSGFLIGRFGFNANETERLGRAYDKITSDKCRKFFDDTLASLRKQGQIHSPFQSTPTTLAQTLAITTINKYSSGLTANDVGVTQAAWADVRDKFENYQKNGIGLGVTIADGRVFLPNNAFYQAGEIAHFFYKDADLAGIITHELFHRAGLNEDQLTTLRDDIQRNCGTPGDALGK